MKEGQLWFTLVPPPVIEEELRRMRLGLPPLSPNELGIKAAFRVRAPLLADAKDKKELEYEALKLKVKVNQLTDDSRKEKAQPAPPLKPIVYPVLSLREQEAEKAQNEKEQRNVNRGMRRGPELNGSNAKKRNEPREKEGCRKP